MGVVKPVFKWAGGKRKSASKIVKVLFGGRFGANYIEPFLGGGAVFFEAAVNGRIGSAHLGDSNPALIAAYEAIRDDLATYVDCLRALPAAPNVNEYLALRQSYNDYRGANKWRRAVLFAWLNKHAFNGLYRENKAGDYNVPWGARRWDPLMSAGEYRQARELFGRYVAAFHAESFDERNWPYGSIIYCDPPYAPSDTRQSSMFASYQAKRWGQAEREGLAAWARKQSERGCRVGISDRWVESALSTYRGAEIHPLEATHVIGRGNAKHKVGELLAIYEEKT